MDETASQVKYGMWLPPDISTHGAGIDSMIFWLHVFMIVLFVGWGAYFVYCLLKYRARRGHKAEYTPIKAKASKYVEVAVVVVEVLILGLLSMPIWAKYKQMPPADQDPVRVRVVAQQFIWNFHYPGADGIFGRTRPELIDGASNPIGLDQYDDKDAMDDIQSNNILVVPMGRPVILEISSMDVIHSLQLNVLRVKQDAIPGMRIPVWFEATDTGEFMIGCAQMCGTGHAVMRGYLKVLSPEDYEAWLVENAPEVWEEDGDMGDEFDDSFDEPGDGSEPAADSAAEPAPATSVGGEIITPTEDDFNDGFDN